MKPKRSRTYWLWLLMLLCIPGGSHGDTICGHDGSAVVEITRGKKTVGTFSVALADTPQSRRQGLMHCPALARGTGMLFVYPQAGKRVFWMKNTAIELAIIFISADNRIASIAFGEPGSLKRIHSPENIRTVLEVNRAESLHLAVGDRVRWRRSPAAQ